MGEDSAPIGTELEQGAMAHKMVQYIIGQILTDEELRARFVDEPAGTLQSLRDRGFDLTNAEIDALARTDRRLWQSGPEWIDARLQRCGLSVRETPR